MLALAAPVPFQGLLAALVPIGILLGPMVMSFVWLQQRVDPSVSSPRPGSTAHVVAMVQGEWSEPVRLDAPPPLVLDEATPCSRTLPPLRKTLERLLALYHQPGSIPGEPWELQLAPDLARQQTADDLEAYLAAGIPPQPVTWLVRPPDESAGRFPVTVTAGAYPPLTVNLVLGDDYPPPRLSAKGAAGAPIQELRVVYSTSREEPVFWRPLAGLGADNPRPLIAWLATINVGWLVLYLLVYLPTLMLVRAILKIA